MTASTARAGAAATALFQVVGAGWCWSLALAALAALLVDVWSRRRRPPELGVPDQLPVAAAPRAPASTTRWSAASA